MNISHRIEVVLFIISLIFINGCSVNRTTIHPEWSLFVDGSVRLCGNGKLEYKEGIPVLELKGSYYEMGYQYGALLKDELVKAFAEIDKSKFGFSEILPIYVKPFAGLYLDSEVDKFCKGIPSVYLDEMKGIADASGIDIDNLRFAAAFPDIVGSIGCTSVIVKKGNKILHARNLDFVPPALGRFPVIINYHPAKKNSYTLVSIIGALPALTGINEKGIALSLNQATILEPSSVYDEPIGYRLRRILEESSTLNECSVLINNYKSYQGWIVSISSAAEAKGLIYDIAGIQQSSHYLAENGAIYAENLFVNDEYNHQFRSISKAGKEYNVDRVDRMKELLPDLSDVNSIFNVLGDNQFAKYANISGAFTINNYETVQSMVFDVSNSLIYFSSEKSYAGWGKVYLYNIKTNQLELYRGVDPRMSEQVDLTNWLEKFYSTPYLAVKEIESRNELKLVELENFLFYYERFPYKVDISKILPAINNMNSKYPDYALPLLVKGMIFLELKKYPEALVAINKGLDSQIAYPYDLARLHRYKAEILAKLNDRVGAREAALKSEDLVRSYKSGKKEMEFLAQLKKYQ